jgi:hypothetical protein
MAYKGQKKAYIPVALACSGMLIFAAKSEIWAKIARAEKGRRGV